MTLIEATPKEENRQIARAKRGDEEAWAWLLKRHEGAMQLAVNKAVRWGRDEDDAWSWARHTLMVCVRNFKPSRKLRFVTYLWQSLRRVQSEAYNRCPIRIPKESYCDSAELAAAAQKVCSLNAELGSGGLTVGETLAAPEPDENDSWAMHRELYWETLPQLSERDQQILEMRRQGHTLQETARQFGLSKERVRQIQERLRKMAGMGRRLSQ